MLFGDGTGTLGVVADITDGVVSLKEGNVPLVEGMVVDFYTADGAAISTACGRRIIKVDRVNRKITLSGATLDESNVPENSLVIASGSYNNELTGLKKLFNKAEDTIYGLDKSQNSWLNPYVQDSIGDITEEKLQRAIDEIEEASGSAPNFIICSWGVRRALQKLFAESNTRIDTMNLAGGYTAMSYNGIPIVVDRFCPKGTIYMLNTNDFALHQLCDWQWLTGDDGRVLKQIPGKPVYTATLVKYAELLCSRPCGQGMLTGVSES